MAKTIPQLTDATTVNAADELIIQQSGITKRATVNELLQDCANVRHYGAKGDGATNDSAAFQAAYNATANRGTVVVPPGSYLLTTPVVPASGKVVIWRVAGSRAGSHYFNAGELPGHIIQTSHTDNSFLSSVSHTLYNSGSIMMGPEFAPEAGARWAKEISTFSVYNDLGKCSITGFATDANSTLTPQNGPNIGVSGFAVATRGGVVSWGMYSDIQIDQSAGGAWIIGLEVAAKNKTNNNKNSTPYLRDGGVLGIWLAGGGDDAYGGAPTHPSNTGITFIKNSHTWNKGIVFDKDCLTGCDGTTGTASAISFARGHKLAWHEPTSGNEAFSIFSIMNDDSAKFSLEAADTGGFSTFLVRNASKGIFGLFRHNGDSNAFYAALQTSSTQATVQVEGSQANGDIEIRPKGTGVVRFGTHAAITTETVTGYVTIKDAGGNTRKLAVVS